MKNKEYYKELMEEYHIPLAEDATDEEVFEWAEKETKQREELINLYGESAWNIHRFMELCRAEDISESFFRQLVRMEMHKCFKKNRDEK